LRCCNDFKGLIPVGKVLQGAHGHHVGQRVEQPRLGRLAVPAGPAGFLVVGFHAGGQVKVGDESNIGFVDTHAKGNGGHHHQSILH
jgi:hypothetical protein